MRLPARMFCIAIAAGAAACGGGDSTKPAPIIPPALVVTSVSVQPGAVSIEIGSTTTLVAEVRDQQNAVMSGKTAAWLSSNPAVATIDASTGVVRGVAVGAVSITATVEGKSGIGTVSVNPLAVSSVSITVPSTPTFPGQTAPLVASLKDKTGAPITGRNVFWLSSNTRVATVDATGNVLAISAGTTTITAQSEGVSGTASFVVTAPPGTVAPTITTVSPATLTPGVVTTITGSNFGTSVASNGVYIAGVKAVISAASVTQLTATVPTSGLPCQGTQPVNVEVTTVSGTGIAKQSMTIATQRNLAVGASFMATSTDNIGCNELPAAGTYVVSVFNASKALGIIGSFELQGSGGGVVASKISPAQATRSINVLSAPPARHTAVDQEEVAQEHEHLMRLERDMELIRQLGKPRNAARSMSVAPRASAGGASFALAPVPTTVGANASINFHFNSCAIGQSTPVTARVVYVGSKAIVLEDNAAPLAGKIDADLIALAKDFEDVSFPLLLNFGNPLAFDDQTDANGRLIMFFTPQVNNQASNLLGFVSSCDFFAPTASPNVSASNQAEIFYARAVTDTSSTSTSLNARGGWKRQMPSTLIHESKHITAFAERFADPRPALNEQVWLEEATAQMASELYGRALHGNSWRSNATYFGTLDCEVRPTTAGCNGATFVMGNHFSFLTDFLENFDTKSILSGSDDNDIYGSAWLFTRWLTDTYGGADEGNFLRSIVKSVTTTGVDNVTTPSGKSWAELLSQFTLMLAADELTAVNAPYTEASWNLPGIFAGYNSDFPTSRPSSPLVMRQATFGSSFLTSANALRGGGAMLIRLSGTPSAPTQLLDLHAGGGAALSPNSTIGIAVLRVQ
ncbi:MAG: Ig-like domain-containing protein [bacterium]